jgi:hypothetical protein
MQAQDEQVLSFQSFRQLFSTGCYAYIHQVRTAEPLSLDWLSRQPAHNTV